MSRSNATSSMARFKDPSVCTLLGSTCFSGCKLIVPQDQLLLLPLYHLYALCAMELPDDCCVFLCALLCYLAEPSMLEYSWDMVWHIYAVGVVWDLNTGILKWLLHVLLGQNQLHSFLSGIPGRLSICEPSRSKLLRSYWRGFTSVTDDSCKVWHEAAFMISLARFLRTPVKLTGPEK